MGELFAEIVHEISADPVKFVVELVQFGILVAIIWAAGFRKKGGMITNLLAERREKIKVQLEEAQEADSRLARARQDAEPVMMQARTEADQILREAREKGKQEREAILASAQEEIANMKRQAQETLEKEQGDALTGIHDQLVDLVTVATRQILEEGLSPAEQRALVQKAVLSSIDDLEGISLS